MIYEKNVIFNQGYGVVELVIIDRCLIYLLKQETEGLMIIMKEAIKYLQENKTKR